LSWFLYRVKYRRLVSVFFMWIYSSSNTSFWRGCLFSNVFFWHSHWESGGCSFMAYFWVHCFTPLVYVSVLMPVPCCFVTMSLYYYLKLGIVIPLVLLFLLRNALAMCYALCLHMNYRIAFIFLWRMPLAFWWGFHWICRLLSVMWLF
jgi:hypothetical protein